MFWLREWEWLCWSSLCDGSRLWLTCKELGHTFSTIALCEFRCDISTSLLIWGIWGIWVWRWLTWLEESPPRAELISTMLATELRPLLWPLPCGLIASYESWLPSALFWLPLTWLLALILLLLARLLWEKIRTMNCGHTLAQHVLVCLLAPLGLFASALSLSFSSTSFSI